MMNLSMKSTSMRGIAISLCALLLFAGFYGVYSERSTARAVFSSSADTPVVIIDAGHGGEDGGAVSQNGTIEKDINLRIAHKLRMILLLNGFHVIMTRESDISVYDDEKRDATLHEKKVSDINNRIALAKAHPEALFVSIHQNKFSSSSVSGAQVFYRNTEESKRLAEIVQSELESVLGSGKSRPAKEADSSIKLMRSIPNTAVLVECGFISNPAEEALLLDDGYQKRIAFSIYSALCKYLSGQESENGA